MKFLLTAEGTLFPHKGPAEPFSSLQFSPTLGVHICPGSHSSGGTSVPPVHTKLQNWQL